VLFFGIFLLVFGLLFRWPPPVNFSADALAPHTRYVTGCLHFLTSKINKFIINFFIS